MDGHSPSPVHALKDAKQVDAQPMTSSGSRGFLRVCLGIALLSLGCWVSVPAWRHFHPDEPVATTAVANVAPIDARARGTDAVDGEFVFRHTIPESGAPTTAITAMRTSSMQDRPTPEASRPFLKPDGLPALPVVFGAPPPGFQDHYRTTLRMPPPPLLDPQPSRPKRQAMKAAQIPPGLNVVAPPQVSTVHVVRDGDDLTGIAIRVYGDPAMADAILAANRDRLRDPAILPIGLTLVLPAAGHGSPTADVPSGRSGWLEPSAG